MTTAPPALPGRTWNKRLKESRELACLLLGMADMRVESAVARSARIDLQLYPGAHHAFDAPNTPLQLLPVQSPPGTQPYVGTDPAARRDAFERVPAFLARYLGN